MSSIARYALSSIKSLNATVAEREDHTPTHEEEGLARTLVYL